MTIARCPNCRDEVRVPSGVSSRATVACPQCDARYTLEEVLLKLPPELIVLDDPSVPSPPIASKPADDSLSLAPPPAFDFEQREAPRFEVPRVGSPRSASSSVRRRRAESSGLNLLSMIAVLGGGLCALPLAQLVLWWVFRQDPVQLGPEVAKYVAFVVPEAFRGGAGSIVKPSPISESSPRDRESRTPRSNDRQDRGSAPSPDASTSSPDRSPTSDPSLSDSRQEPPLSGEANGPVTPPFARKRPAKLDDLPRSTPAELDVALRDALLGFDDWSSASSLSDEERGPKLKAFYDHYCQLGEALARFDPSTAEERWIGQVDQVLRLQLADAALANFLANRATQRLGREDQDSQESEATPDPMDDDEASGEASEGLSSPEETTQGIALAGRIIRIEPGEEFTTIVLRLGEGDGPTVRVASWLPTPTDWAEGRSMVVLGRVETPERFGWDPKEARGASVLGGYFWLLESNMP